MTRKAYFIWIVTSLVIEIYGTEHGPLIQTDVYNECKSKTEYCACQVDIDYELILTCQNFTSFAQLHFTAFHKNKFKTIKIIPSVKLDLDASLNFDGIVLAGQSILIHLVNIKSISYLLNPFKTINVEGRKKFDTLTISNSTFELRYMNEVRKCDTTLYHEMNDPLNDPIFSYMNNIEFENVHFNEHICPLFLDELKLDSLKIINTKSQIKFMPLRQMQVDVNIEHLTISNVKFHVLDNLSILNKDIFKATSKITIENSVIGYIANDTFKFLTNLKVLEFANVNMKNLIVNIGWLWSLNGNVRADLTNPGHVESLMQTGKYFKLILKHHNYMFPDEDLCSFQNFPFEKLVFMLVEQAMPLRCTCTLLWLNKYERWTSLVSAKDRDFDDYRKGVECLTASDRQVKSLISDCRLSSRENICKGLFDSVEDNTFDVLNLPVEYYETSAPVSITEPIYVANHTFDVSTTKPISLNKSDLILESNQTSARIKNNFFSSSLLFLIVAITLFCVFIIVAIGFFVFRTNKTLRVTTNANTQTLLADDCQTNPGIITNRRY